MADRTAFYEPTTLQLGALSLASKSTGTENYIPQISTSIKNKVIMSFSEQAALVVSKGENFFSPNGSVMHLQLYFLSMDRSHF